MKSTHLDSTSKTTSHEIGIPILITGATGNVGTEVIRELLDLGTTPIAAVPESEIGSDRIPKTIERRPFDFIDAQTWEAAMDGVKKVFLMRPPHISSIKRDMLPFLRHLATLEIESVAFLSVQGADRNRLVPHRKVEDYLVELDLPYTFVRPSFFMQNLTTTHLTEIRDERRIYVPAGDGRTNFIDVRDIGVFFARVLTEAGHVREAYTVTGVQSFSYAEVAERLSDLTGVGCRYVSARPIPFLLYHRRMGKPWGFALAMLVLYSVAKLGKADGTTDTFGRIVGRPAGTLDTFIKDHAQILTGSD